MISSALSASIRRQTLRRYPDDAKPAILHDAYKLSELMELLDREDDNKVPKTSIFYIPGQDEKVDVSVNTREKDEDVSC